MDPVKRTGRDYRSVHLKRNAAFVLCLLSGLAAPSVGEAAEQSLEYQVKAAFLLNFTKFTDWPPGAFADADAPIAICILGKDPFGRTLDDIVQGEAVNARKLIVQRVSQVPASSACQVVFVSSSEKDVPRILNRIGRGVLTVGEGERFVQEGGIIAFVIDDRHVRFDINQTAAANASVRLSSRLMSVARSVEK